MDMDSFWYSLRDGTVTEKKQKKKKTLIQKFFSKTTNLGLSL